jgi:hypothetical protein
MLTFGPLPLWQKGVKGNSSRKKRCAGNSVIFQEGIFQSVDITGSKDLGYESFVH